MASISDGEIMQVLPIKAMADSAPRMGRPKLGVEATTVRLPRELLERIDRLEGPNQRAKFIRAAVEAEVARREQNP